MNTQPGFSALGLRGLRLDARVGCSALERTTPQPVCFDFILRFKTMPAACESDQIDDTVCYAALAERLRFICENGEYALIERLAAKAYQEIKQILPASVELWLCVTKEHPPISGLEGGASFCLGDWERDQT